MWLCDLIGDGPRRGALPRPPCGRGLLFWYGCVEPLPPLGGGGACGGVDIVVAALSSRS